MVEQQVQKKKKEGGRRAGEEKPERPMGRASRVSSFPFLCKEHRTPKLQEDVGQNMDLLSDLLVELISSVTAQAWASVSICKWKLS